MPKRKAPDNPDPPGVPQDAKRSKTKPSDFDDLVQPLINALHIYDSNAAHTSSSDDQIAIDQIDLSQFNDNQKHTLVEDLSQISSKIASLMGKIASAQGNKLSLGDLQINHNLPEEKQFVELGLWKAINRSLSNTYSKVNSTTKLYTKKQQLEAMRSATEVRTMTVMDVYNDRNQPISALRIKEGTNPSKLVCAYLDAIHAGVNPFGA